MLKKLFFTAAAAAAVSVPLAGVAWADKPSDPGSNGNAAPGTPNENGLGQGGVPAAAGDYLARTYGPGLFPDKVPPGSVFSQAAKADRPDLLPPNVPSPPPCDVQHCNTPEGYGAALTQQFNLLGLPDIFPSGSSPGVPHPPPAGTVFDVGPTIPGSVVKLFTPGCNDTKGKRPTVTITANGVSRTETAGCVS